MDRVSLRSLVLLALLVAGPACASVWEYVGAQEYSDTLGGFRAATADGTCQAYGTSVPGASGGAAISVVEQSGGYIQFGCRLSRDGAPWDTFPDQFRSRCYVDGSTGIPGGGRSCYVSVSACPAGQAANAQGVCDVVCPGAGTVVGAPGCAAGAECIVEAGTGLGRSVCLGGCAAEGGMSGTSQGKNWVWGPYVSTGAKCSGSTGGVPPPASEPPVQCPAPQCPGTVTVNGTTTSICVACGATQSPGPVTSTTGSETGASGTTTSTGTSSSSTTCSGGTCSTTTTTTVTGSNGTSSQQQATTSQTQASFCEAHPADVQCKGSDERSSFGGSCAGFTCSGDAVQCAIAQEQHRRNCALFDTPTTLSQKGVEAASGTDPADHPRLNSQTVDFSLSSMIDSTPLFGSSGSCPSDVSLSVMGRPIVLPFASICPYLTMAGAGFMMMCYLVAALIVFRRD